MPEKKITAQEHASVFNWIFQQPDREIIVQYNLGVGVYRVNEEPMVITYPEGHGWKNLEAYILQDATQHVLYCSDRHAQALSEAGIVNFNEKQERVE